MLFRSDFPLPKGRGTRDQIANICWIIKKARVPEKYKILLSSLKFPWLPSDMWPHFVWPLCMYSCAYFGLSRWLSWKRICLQCGRPGFRPCAHFTSPSRIFIHLMCVLVCTGERDPQTEDGWGMSCVSVDRERKPDLTASCWPGAQRNRWFSLCLFLYSFQVAP